MSTMRWTSMDDYSIKLKLFFLSKVDQMSEVFFQVKFKIRVQFDSIKSLVVESESVQSEHKHIWEMLELST